MTLNLAENRFPHMSSVRMIVVDQVHLFVRLNDEFVEADGSGTELTLNHPRGGNVVDLGAAFSFGNMRQVSINSMNSGLGEWTLTISAIGAGLAGASNQLNPNAVEDVVVILHYIVND